MSNTGHYKKNIKIFITDKFTVNVLKFERFSVGFLGWNLQNTCQNSKQGRPIHKQSDLGLHCLSRPFWQATC